MSDERRSLRSRTTRVRSAMCLVALVVLLTAFGTTTDIARSRHSDDTSSRTASSPDCPGGVELDGTNRCALPACEHLPALGADRAGRSMDSDVDRTVIEAGVRVIPGTVEGTSAWTHGKQAGKAATTDPAVTSPPSR